jgi:hypothetical protein
MQSSTAQRTRQQATTKRLPLLIHISELPGKMCMKRLERAGILTELDDRTAFLSIHATSLYGRAQIAAQMTPLGSAACATLALWVWLGGEIPQAITIISNSHYRAPIFGRPIQVFNRQVGPRNLMRIGKLTIVNPLWVACQLACFPPEDFDRDVGLERFTDFLRHFDLSTDSCRKLLKENPRWPGHSCAEELISGLEKTS